MTWFHLKFFIKNLSNWTNISNVVDYGRIIIGNKKFDVKFVRFANTIFILQYNIKKVIQLEKITY